jgi:hypothetical protein
MAGIFIFTWIITHFKKLLVRTYCLKIFITSLLKHFSFLTNTFYGFKINNFQCGKIKPNII